MITARTPDGLRVVMQVAHQQQCALLMDAWGNAEFARPEPWGPVVEAAGVHDEGWRQWEQAPGVLPDGRPRGFVAMDIAEHVRIHRASAAAAQRHGDRVGLLVGMHGAGLVMRRFGLDGEVMQLQERPGPARDLVLDRARAGRALRAGIGEGVGMGEWSWAAYRILQAVDLLSLYLTWSGLVGREHWTLRRVPRCPGDEAGAGIAVSPVDDLTAALHPWPFGTDRVEAPVEARTIADRAYPGADDLADALTAAPVQVLPMAVVPAG